MQTSQRAAKSGGYIPCNATEEEIKVAFTGRCDICGVPELELDRKLRMDHSHEDGEFRGWLCHKCNVALSFFQDSEDVLIDALHYLMNHRTENIKE